MEWREFTARSIEEALTEASVALKTPSTTLDYQVISEGKRGLFGIGNKPAVIRARKREAAAAESSLAQCSAAERTESYLQSSQNKQYGGAKTSLQAADEDGVSKEDGGAECAVTGENSVDSAKREYYEQKKENPHAVSLSAQSGISDNKDILSELELAGLEAPRRFEVPSESKKVFDENVDVEAIVQKFLGEIFMVMKIEAKVKVKISKEEFVVYINIEGEDMGVLIGKRGQTLDSLQYLTSLVINRSTSSYLKVKMDTENYRARRKETLENLARNIAYKVKRTKRPVSLEPMNPYERRIIHSALQNDRFVETHSEGEEPYRRVVITLKRGYREFNNRGNSHGRSYHNKKDYRSSNVSETSEPVTGE